MKTVLLRWMGSAEGLIHSSPLVALFFLGGLLALFLTILLRKESAPVGTPARLLWAVYWHFLHLLWAVVVVVFVVLAFSLTRVYLRQSVAEFQRGHGRITQANYQAVQTIWGAEQEQAELRMEIFYDEEVVERIESEDLTKPAVLRKRTIRRFMPGNPFQRVRHQVTLIQNPRKKGSALYGGYETDCQFNWVLKNPADRDLRTRLIFPLPAASAVYHDLTVQLGGKDVLQQVQLHEGNLVLELPISSGESFPFQITFKSRGMSFWYFQVREPREIRDFLLTLHLPDLPRNLLNYPEGCMSPTEIQPTQNGKGSILSYRLDHAISAKGMGVSLPTLTQPGEKTRAVLASVERGWMMGFSLLLLGCTLSDAKPKLLPFLLVSTASAAGYGLLADFSDLALGFWGTAAVIVLPMFLLFGWVLRQYLPGARGILVAFQFILFGLGYPMVAGLDPSRQTLYFNVTAVLFIAWLMLELYSRAKLDKNPPL